MTNAQRANTPSLRASPTRIAPSFPVAADPVLPVVTGEKSDATTDSGYHGLPEDEADVDPVLTTVPSSAETHDTLEAFPPKSPLRLDQNVANHSERRSTTDKSFYLAEEASIEGNVIAVSPKKTESRISEFENNSGPTMAPSSEQAAPIIDQAPENAVKAAVLDTALDEDLPVDESRSPSQGSSPARPLVRKSSLTFAALPAREPLTTKKSIGARTSRTSHLDQSRTHGSLLGRFTGGKSLGSSRQPEPDREDDTNDTMDIDMEKPALSREESDGDSKMAQLHNKSSTQRLHDKINMLGKSQPARPTKSISAVAAAPGISYPELPIAEPQAESSQHTFLSSRTMFTSVSQDEDDDDWIQPPHMEPNTLNRPQLSKSISADVMEDIRGKQTIGGPDFGYGRNYEQAVNPSSPVRRAQAHEVQSSGKKLSRAATVSQATSSAEAVERTTQKDPDGIVSSNLTTSTAIDQSTTPFGSPASRRYVDGPLSASKSKLQSIMKTARGLFSSSAGVSAQAKMETFSPLHTRTHKEIQGPPIESLENKATEGGLAKAVSNANTRRTRSSTEQERKRKESEVQKIRQGEEDHEKGGGKESPKFVAQKLMQPQGPPVEAVLPQTKQTRQSPRKMQTHEGPSVPSDAIEDDLTSNPIGPPASYAPTQQSQPSKPTTLRRPVKPAKEVVPKPKPQPVAIRVGTLSQRIPLSNAALSSTLQESLPQSQPKQLAAGRKPSNASLQTSVSNNSLKSSATSAAPKPKALLAAERKKEQVSVSEAA